MCAKNKFLRNGRCDCTEGKSCTTIAFVHHKGGTGKTTSCVNIAGWLSKMGKKVLLVDLDPQGNATAGLGVDRKTCEGSVYDVLLGRTGIEDIVLETDSGVNLVPSSLDLLAAETHIAGKPNNAKLLKKSLADIEKYFDYILIDVPPGSTLLMINGMVAAENIIIPLDSGIFAFETMETLKTLILDLHDELGVEVNIIMVLLRKHDFFRPLFRKGPTQKVKTLLRKFLTENITSPLKIFTIPFSGKIYRTQVKGKPISHYAPLSNVGRAYKKIAKEIIKIY